MPCRSARELVATAALVLLPLLACKKKPPPDTSPSPPTVSTTAARASELKPKMKARIDKLAAMALKAKSEPKVRKERPLKTKLDKEKFIVIGEKWLDNVHYEPATGEIDLDNTTLSLCGYALDKAEPKDDDLKYFDECLNWEHVAVVRSRRIILPVVKMATKTFEPGQLDGDLLLFDLASGEIVGRYLLGITNSDELKWFEGKPESDWKDESKRDLVKNVQSVVEERLLLERDSSGTPD